MTIETMKQSQIPNVWELWNNQVEEQYRLQPRLMDQIIKCEDFDPESSFVAIVDGDIVGAIVIKRWQRSVLAGYQGHAWISLIVVAKEYQRQGLASQLLDKSIQILQEHKYTILHVGKGMNPLFCGIPSHWNSIAFFQHHGFTSPGMTYDMRKVVSTPSSLPLRKKFDYDIRLATKDDLTAVDAFFERCFPGRWHQEFTEYVEQGGKGSEFAIMTYKDDVIAFCRINHPTKSQPMYNTNFSHNFDQLFGVGPLGVDDRYRGYSLGYDITAYAVNQAMEQGATDIIIDWTSHVTFYQKFGCQVWQEYMVLDLHL